MDESQELINEFLVESNENLAQLDQDFVELEKHPKDRNLLSSVFRTLHTIKGTCEFLGYTKLETITHRAENLLSKLRDGERDLDHSMTTLLLEAVDAVKRVRGEIETNATEGSSDYTDLCERLQAICDGAPAETVEGPASSASPRPADQGKPASVSATETGVEGKPLEPQSGKTAVPLEAKSEPAPPAAQAAVAAGARGSAGDQQGAQTGAPLTESRVASSNIRVDVSLLDKLMNLVGELVLVRNQILQHTSSLEDTAFTATSQRLNLITTELQANVMKTRMQPISVVWNKFPRVVRDIGQSLGKEIELVMEGAKTDLDKTIIESIKDPLTHLVRNSCDHGIETSEERAAREKSPRGTLTLRAYHEGGQVNIEISDDGAGIDPERLKQKAIQNGLVPADRAERMSDRELLNLIFLPGLSTAKKVTNVSGWGVGMDVVKTNIEKIGGSIDLQSKKDHGTTIKIKIPLTLAIIPALIVNCAGERFAIPQVNLVELVRLESGASSRQIEWIYGAPVYRLRGRLLPLIYLNRILNIDDQASEDDESVNIIVLQAEERTFGLVVDSVNDTAEIVVKPLSKLLKGLKGHAGATIMGDGRVALILDVMGLAQLGRVVSEAREPALGAKQEQAGLTGEKQAVLLFRSGSAKRLGVPLALVDRLEEFSRSKIENSGGRDVVQYRDKILPLVPLSQLLSFDTPADQTSLTDPVQVIVFSERERHIGIVVDQIVDVVEEVITVRAQTERAGILGTAVVGKQVTDFIDLRYIIDAVDANWFGDRPESQAVGRRVLVAEASPFSRGLLRSYFEMAGYQVREAGDGDQVIRSLRAAAVDVVVSSIDLPGRGGFDLLKQIRAVPGWSRLPVVALTNEPDEATGRSADECEFDDYQLKMDCESMLSSVERLAAAVQEHEPVEQRS